MSEPTPDSRVGSLFGPYRLRRLLGRGGMGEVYEAEDTVKERVVALKLLSKAYSQDAVFRGRMQREARHAGRLQEPHVVPIHDYGEIEGQLYIDMRLIDGVDLRAVLQRGGPMTPPRAVAIVRQIASALDAAHASGVVHRDVKPENILINREDFAYLVDFGIAAATSDEHLTQMGTAIGTWKYMAPERFTNGEVTYRADIYALACVLYECLTGAPPYPAESTAGLVSAHMMEPIPRPSVTRPGVPSAFDQVVARGMAKQATDRYASAGELAHAAHQALSTPDQDHATTILRRSQQAGPPGGQPGRFVSGPPSNPGNTPTASTPAGYPSNPGHVPAPAASTPAGLIGGWPGQPSGSPAPPAGPPPWNQTPPRNRGPALAIGIAAAVVLVVLGGLGIWLAGRSESPVASTEITSTTRITTSSSRTSRTTTTTAARSEAENRLMGQLPTGYPPGSCRPTTVEAVGTVWEDALAIVQCDQNTQTGGPSRAVYGLFADTDALGKAFDSNIHNVTLVNCPGADPSPVSWHYDNDPNVNAGMLGCGTYNNHPNVVWSNNKKLTLNDVRGDPPTVEELHTWWAAYG